MIAFDNDKLKFFPIGTVKGLKNPILYVLSQMYFLTIPLMVVCLACLAVNIPSISACSRIHHWLPGQAAVTWKYHKQKSVFSSLNTLWDRGKETVNMSPTT
jgi:hypothetical protein